MKIHSIAISAILAISAIGISAQAADAGKFTAEVGYAPMALSSGGYTSSPDVLRGTFGYEINSNLAVEGTAGFGVTASDMRIGALNVGTKIESIYGVYFKPKANVTPDVEVFGRFGYATTTLSGAISGRTANTTESSGSYGVGASYRLTPATAVSLDYMSYLDNNGDTVRGFGTNVSFKF